MVCMLVIGFHRQCIEHAAEVTQFIFYCIRPFRIAALCDNDDVRLVFSHLNFVHKLMIVQNHDEIIINVLQVYFRMHFECGSHASCLAFVHERNVVGYCSGLLYNYHKTMEVEPRPLMINHIRVETSSPSSSLAHFLSPFRRLSSLSTQIWNTFSYHELYYLE